MIKQRKDFDDFVNGHINRKDQYQSQIKEMEPDDYERVTQVKPPVGLLESSRLYLENHNVQLFTP